MLGKICIIRSTSIDLLTFDGWINFFQVIYICSTQLNTSMTSLSFLLLLHKVLDAVYSGSCPDHSQRPLIRWSVRDCELIGKLPGWSDGIWEVRRPANLLIAKSAEFLRLLPSRSTKFLPNFFGHTHNFPTMSSSLAVPFRRRSLHQMTTSGQFGGTGGSAGGCCFWVSSSSSSSSGAVSTFPSAAKCRSATSSSTKSTILSMMARVSARSGSSSTVGDRSRHLYRRNTAILSKSSGSASSGSGSSGITNCATVMGGPSSALASALSSVTRTARIRPRSYSTTPIVRQQHPKQPGGQKRSQSTIIGVPGGPQSASGSGAGVAGAGRGAGSGTAGAESMLGGAPSGQTAQATWKDIYHLLRERCRVFLLKPRRLVSLNL